MQLSRYVQVPRGPRHLAFMVPLFFGAVFAFTYPSVNTGLGETGKVALALLARGELSDPYLIPTGPTAHVSPVLAGLIAAVYALAGPATAASRVLLSLCAALAYAASAWVVIRLLEEARVVAPLRWAAAVVMALVPFSLFYVSVHWRQWDQAYAALILVSVWLIKVRTENGAHPLLQGAALGVAGGLGSLVSPLVLPPVLAVFFWLSWLAWRGRIALSWWRGAAVGLVLMLGVLAAWGWRNQVALGQFIVTRSNFGLELAVGNAPLSALKSLHASATPPSSQERFTAALTDIHPYLSMPAAQEVARLGEVVFMRALKDKAVMWINDDWPGFLKRMAMRLRNWLFPPYAPSFFPVVGAEAVRIYSMVMGGALVLCALLLVARRKHIEEVLMFVALPMCPYFITHMNDRYVYLVCFSSLAIVFKGAGLLIKPRP